MRYVLKYTEDGQFNRDCGWPVQLSEATIYESIEEATEAARTLDECTIVPLPTTTEKYVQMTDDAARAITRAIEAAAVVRRRGHLSEAQVLAEGIDAMRERMTELARTVAELRGAIADLERREHVRETRVREMHDALLEAETQASWWRDLVRGA